MAWRRRLGLFFILLVLPFLSLEANAQGRVSSLAPYSVEGLSVGGFVAPNSRQYKRYKCQPSEQYANSIWCHYSENRRGLNKSLTILHLYNNIVTYVNKEEWPASLTAPGIEQELTRLSQRFNSTPRIYKSPSQAGFPAGIIATWGAIELRPLGANDLAILAEGRSPKVGLMVDYLNNFRKSASRGLPVYGLGGGEGFVWIAAFDANGKGKLRFFAADPSDMIHISTHYADAPAESPKPQSPMEPKSTSPSAAPPKGEQTSGTGFFVSAEGHIVTNAHVVRGCVKRSVTMGSALPVTARVLAEDVANDLALLKVEAKPAAVTILRAGVKIGEKIAVFGFPLVGVLSTKGNFTEGNVSALTGIRDDTAFLQISAPVQPGNSGGPVLDGSGNVVGVVVGKLDAIKVAEATQDVPQNVNFAIKTTVVINFLDTNGVSFTTGNLGQAMPPADLAERGKSISVLVVCEE